jgi:acyl-CoA synthetase (AMP-forming)/AMP-acid ligase II
MTTASCQTINAGDWIRLSAQRFGERSCFIDEGTETSHTFAETNERVTRLANALLACGVGKGDRLVILANDSHRYMETLLASMKLGACYVPLNVRLAEFEIQNLIKASGATWLFASGRYVRQVSRMTASTGSSLRVIAYDPADSGSADADSAPSAEWADVTMYEDFLATGDIVEPSVNIEDSDILGLAFTSGTTGLPKGVLQSQGMIKHLVMACLLDYEIGPDECRYSAAPMFHISGMAMIMMGVMRGYPNLVASQFDPKQVMAWLSQDRLTGCFMVPTMLASVLDEPDADQHDYARLRSIIYGAAPMPPTLLRRAMDTFSCDFVQAFGAGTEAGLQAVLSPADHRRAVSGHEYLLNSIGKPASNVDLRLCDDDLNDVTPGSIGEIVTRSDMVMSGYLDNPEASDEALAGGWFRAGDLAWTDDEGYLYLSGRKKDMIIRGGENVYPIEIETVLFEHDSIKDVAVVGHSDDHWGEIVVAYLVLEPDARTPTDDELAVFCRQKLARYKVPTTFVWVEVLPLNASGKVLKRQLQTTTSSTTTTKDQ